MTKIVELVEACRRVENGGERMKFIILFVLVLTLGQSFVAQAGTNAIIHLSDLEAIKDGKDCSHTKKIVRPIDKSSNIYHTTLKKLFSENLSPLAPHLREVRVSKGAARLYFTSAAKPLLNGSACQQQSVKQPIERTLKEFKEVDSVKYYLDDKLVTEWDA